MATPDKTRSKATATRCRDKSRKGIVLKDIIQNAVPACFRPLVVDRTRARNQMRVGMLCASNLAPVHWWITASSALFLREALEMIA